MSSNSTLIEQLRRQRTLIENAISILNQVAIPGEYGNGPVVPNLQPRIFGSVQELSLIGDAVTQLIDANLLV